MDWKNSTCLGFRRWTKPIEPIKLYQRSFCHCYSLCFYISMHKLLLHCNGKSFGRNIYKYRSLFHSSKIYYLSFLLEDIMYTLVVFLQRFYDIRKQSSPNPCYYVRAVINLHLIKSIPLSRLMSLILLLLNLNR